MAANVGKDGKATIGANTIAFVDSWSLNPSIDIVDITAFGSTFRDRMQTIKDWSADFTMTLDRSDTEQESIMDQFEDATLANIALRFYVLSASYWSGNALVTSATVNSAVADKITVSVSAVGNGALSWTSS